MHLQVEENTSPMKAKWLFILLVLVSICSSAGYLPNSNLDIPPPQTELFYQFVLDAELAIFGDDSPSLKASPFQSFYLCGFFYRPKSFVQKIAEHQFLAKQEQILFSLNQHLRQQIRVVQYFSEEGPSVLL